MNLPWAYIASAAFSLLATLGYGRWVAPLSRRAQIIGSQALVAVTLIAFWFPLRNPDPWIAGAFYVWIQVFGVLLVSQFFLMGNDLFDPRQAKRIYGFIGAGGLAGGIAGAAAAGFLANEIGSVNLLWLGIALLAGSTALSERVFRLGRFRRGSGGAEPRDGERLFGGLGEVRRVGHLRMIALVVFLAVLASTLVDWLYSSAVEAAHPTQGEQTEFIGQSFAVFNAIALATQLFLTSPILRYLGLGWGLLALPLGLSLGLGSVFVLPSLWTASTAKGADTSLSYSVDQSAREILYLPVPTYLVQRAKPFIDVVVRRLADGVAGALLLLGGATALGLRGLSLITLGVVGLWMGAAVRAGRTYRRALERLLVVRDVDLEVAVDASLDSASVRELLRALDPGVEADRVHAALDLLAPLPARVLRAQLLALLEHADDSVRARAVDLLAEFLEGEDLAHVREMEKDPAGKVRARAALLLVARERNGRLPRMEEWLESEDRHLLEAGLTAMLTQGDEGARQRAADAMGRLLTHEGDAAAAGRLAVARALGRVPGPEPVHRHLETLLHDDDPGVLAAAIHSAGVLRRRRLLPFLLPHLASRRTRTATRKALAGYGEELIPDLAAALRDPDLPSEVRRWLPGVFVGLGTRAAYRALLEGLPAITTKKNRLYALKALNKMRRRHPHWDSSPDLIRAELDRELAEAYDIERRRVVLAKAREEERLPGLPSEAYGQTLAFLSTSAIERAFRLQGLLYAPQTIYFAYAGLTGATARGAHALELLETSLRREDAARILPLIDPDVPPERRVRLGRQWYPLADQGLAEDLEDALARGEPWVRAYAARLAAAAYADDLGPELERLAASGPSPAKEIARAAIREEDTSMALSSVDKAAALRRADLLRELGADDLLQLAAVAEERRFDPGQYLFYEGEDGDYLYVILDGRIRAERGGKEVYVAGPGETIGTFAILDREPRSASARATSQAHALAIHRADLAQILADNYTLVEGLFSYLTGIIRELNQRQFPVDHPPRIPE